MGKHTKLYELIAQEQPFCLMCGSTHNLHIHHILYGSIYGTRDKLTYYENLIKLCENCHRLVHSNKNKYIPILQDIRGKMDENNT